MPDFNCVRCRTQDTLSDILLEEPALGSDETPQAGLANTKETQLLNALTKAGLVR